jgi:Gas vesicle synthesis protein GvpL/GvpF
MTDTAYYLFCFARGGQLPELRGTGMDGERPLLVRNFPGIAAVLSTVRVTDFCGPEAEARMEDLSWLGIRALRHEAVIEEVMAHSPVFPSRFGTIFSSLEKLESQVKRHCGTISQFLNRMTDHDEFGLKGMLNREKALQGLQSRYQAGMDLASLAPGMRYLHEQKARMAVEKELKSWLQKTCARVADDLRSYATDFQTRKVIGSGDAKSNSEVVLNWAFLVPRGTRTDLCDHVERTSSELADQGLTFEITGPWPPYNFTPQLLD